MTQAQRLLARLRQGPATLNQLLDPSLRLAAEYRRTMTDLRHEGYVIIHHRYRSCDYCSIRPRSAECPARVAGQNLYTLEAEPARVEANGQMRMVYAG